MLRKLDPNTPEEDLRAEELRKKYREKYESLTKEELLCIIIEGEVSMDLWEEANDKAQEEFRLKQKKAREEELDNWEYTRDDD